MATHIQQSEPQQGGSALGDRMKLYESLECGRRLIPLLPVMARMDGRAFHRFTRDMTRPFDPVFTQIMIDTTVSLMQETGACVGYTQSDEISLVWHTDDVDSHLWFDGRVHKMVSQLGAHTTLHFYRLLLERYPRYANRMPTFDARVWQVPSRTEAVNTFVWREWDARKNSISMAASSVYGHRELDGKTGEQRLQMLLAKGIDWEKYPTHFKRGTYVRRRTVQRPFTTEEWEGLPERHAARSNPSLVVTRREIQVLDLPPLASLENREAVIFEGAEPIRRA